MKAPQILIIGGGWAGLAAALTATACGAQVSVWEMAPRLGGRAKSFTTAEGLERDNGQHLLIGAYTECLRLMRWVGLSPEEVLVRTPLDLRLASGAGFYLPNSVRGPLQLLAGLCASGQGPGAQAWRLKERWQLLRVSWGWQRQKWRCPEDQSVADLCASLPPKIIRDLIEPLCVSALNTPIAQASGQVFLRVLQEALWGGVGASDLLIPKVPLSVLWPAAAIHWLEQHGAEVHTHRRALSLLRAGEVSASQGSSGGLGPWQVRSTVGDQHLEQNFDQVILACPPQEAARLLPQGLNPAWQTSAQALRYEAIATVYLQVEGVPHGKAVLPRPMMALRTSDQAPAQFIFDRGPLGAPPGELALVVSACSAMDRESLTLAVLNQAQQLLGSDAVLSLSPNGDLATHSNQATRPILTGLNLRPVHTLIEKRATFACTPGLKRPSMAVGPQLWACGDYVEGPFPATLEGAVRSGVAAAEQALKR